MQLRIWAALWTALFLSPSVVNANLLTLGAGGTGSAGPPPLVGFFIDDTGTDTGSCTEAAPCATMGFVDGLMAAGDTLYCRSGTYTSQQTFATNGLVGSRIKIKPYPGEVCTFDGAGLGAGIHPVDINGDYVDFDGTTSGGSGNTANNIIVTGGPQVGLGFTNTLSTCAYNIQVNGQQGTGIFIWSDGAEAASDGNCIKYSEIFNTNLENNVGIGNHIPGWGQAITCHKGKNCLVASNYIHDNYGEGTGCVIHDGCTVQDNTVVNNFSIQLYNDGAKNSIWQRNFAQCGTASAFLDNDGTRGNGFSMTRELGGNYVPDGVKTLNNIIMDCDYNLNYFKTVASSGPTNWVIAGNTLVNGQRANMNVDADTASGNTNVDNICYQSVTGRACILGDYITGYTSNNNLCFNGACYGTAFVEGDPLFVNAAGTAAADFQLTSSSPARGAGITNGSLTVDYFGTTRASADSIGAHYLAGSAPTPPTLPTYARTMYLCTQTAEWTNPANSTVTWMNAVICPFTPDASSTYYVFGSLETNAEIATSDVKTRIYDGTTVLLTGNIEDHDTAPQEYNGSGYLTSFTTGGSPVLTSVRLQFQGEAAATVTHARFGRLWIVKGIATDQYIMTAANGGPIGTSEVAIQTLTWTPASTTDYWMFGYASAGVSNDPNMSTLRLNEGATKRAENYAQYDDAATVLPTLVTSYAAGLTAVSQTWTLGMVHNNAGNTAAVTNRTLLALDVTGMTCFQNSATATDGSASTSNFSTYTDSLTYAPTTAAKQHLFFTTGGMLSASTTVSGYMDETLDGTEIGNIIKESGGTTLAFGYNNITMPFLSAAAHTFKIRAANESGAVVVTPKQIKIVGCQIESWLHPANDNFEPLRMAA